MERRYSLDRVREAVREQDEAFERYCSSPTLVNFELLKVEVLKVSEEILALIDEELMWEGA